MSDDHKIALAQGRRESLAVRHYLELLDSAAPKNRGRRRTADSINKRLAAIDQTLPEASVLQRLQLVQEKADLESELHAQSSISAPDVETVRKAFIKVAKNYGERKGISYTSWRAVGVDAATLKEAGIGRGLATAG